MLRSRFLLGSVAGFALFGLTCVGANAGNLIVSNSGSSPIHCAVAAGQPSGRSAFDVLPGTSVSTAATDAVTLVSCGALALGGTGLDAKSTDRILVLNGQQKRALRVALFPYLPSFPSGDLSRLTRALEAAFTQAHPDVALQLVMSTDVDPYAYGSFKTTFGRTGYDVVEAKGRWSGSSSKPCVRRRCCGDSSPRTRLPTQSRRRRGRYRAPPAVVRARVSSVRAVNR